MPEQAFSVSLSRTPHCVINCCIKSSENALASKKRLRATRATQTRIFFPFYLTFHATFSASLFDCCYNSAHFSCQHHFFCYICNFHNSHSCGRWYRIVENAYLFFHGFDVPLLFSVFTRFTGLHACCNIAIKAWKQKQVAAVLALQFLIEHTLLFQLYFEISVDPCWYSFFPSICTLTLACGSWPYANELEWAATPAHCWWQFRYRNTPIWTQWYAETSETL